MDGNSNTTEAERWLTIAEKLLVSRDLHGTRTFAIRARESAPVLADQILAVTDTLLAAQSNPQDWYGILQLVPLTQSMEVVASQYRKLAMLLNYGKNGLSFADQAFRFVSEAWNVLSNPSKKASYDNELRFLQFGPVSQFSQQYHQHQHPPHQQPQLQQQPPPQTQTLFMQQPPPKETQTLFMQQPPAPPPPKKTQPLFMQPPLAAPPPKETQPLFMQPLAPKETQTLFMQTPPIETQPLFVRGNNNKDNAALEGGGQLGLNNNPPESTRPAESAWARQINQIGLAGSSQINQSVPVSSNHISRPEPAQASQTNQISFAGPSQVNQSGSVSSSHISRPEPTRTSQVNRPEPTQASQTNQINFAQPGQNNQSGSVGLSHISLPEPKRTSQVNRSEPNQPEPTRTSQVGIGSSSEVNRTEPIRTVEINQTATTTPPVEHSRAGPNGVTGRTNFTRPSQAIESEGPTFWTACPYCYVLYEYQKVYEDCTLRCQTKNCRRAYHAVVIPSPPVNEKDTHFRCWGFFPIGYSGNDKNKGGHFSGWSPISNMFACPVDKNPGKQKTAKKPAPRVYYEDHDAYVEIFDSSGPSEDDDDDDEWQKHERKKKQAKNSKRKGSAGRKPQKAQSERVKKGSNEQVRAVRCANLNHVPLVPKGEPTAESSRRGVANSGRKHMVRGAKNLGKLDLNVEFSNEVEESVQRRSEGNHAGYGEEDNIEGNGFFEGLDEFLSSLPILQDDKVKATE